MTEPNPLAVCEPLGDRVVVLRDAMPDKIGNVEMTDEFRQQRRQTGRVISKGPTVKDMRIVVGARVIVGGYAGTEITDGTYADPTESYTILHEEEIMAVIPDPVGVEAARIAREQINVEQLRKRAQEAMARPPGPG